MKICFVYSSIFNLGGIQRCITDFSNYLTNKGYEVTVLCSESNIKVDRNIYGLNNKVKVIFSKKKNKLSRLLNFYRKPMIYLNKKFGFFKNSKSILKNIYYPYYHDIEKIINENNYDIVISSATYFNALLPLLKINKTIKLIGWQHSSHMYYFEDGQYKNQNAIIKNMFEKLDSYIVLTDDDKKLIKRDYGYNVKRIYNPINFKETKSGNLENKIFIAVGRLCKEKRFDLLINNFKKFNEINKEWKLHIFGDGPEKSNLEEQLHNLNLKKYVKIFPFTNKILSKYLQSSIYCMTSIGEGFGLVVVEAMESGIPVISYDIPSMKEILNDNCAILVKEGNNEEYVSAMLELANDKKLYQRYSKYSKKRAKDFYFENIGVEWESLFNELKGIKKNEIIKKNNRKNNKKNL